MVRRLAPAGLMLVTLPVIVLSIYGLVANSHRQRLLHSVVAASLTKDMGEPAVAVHALLNLSTAKDA